MKNLTHVSLSAEADWQLQALKARTGLPLSILCRLDFCLSLVDPTLPYQSAYPPNSTRGLNRFALTGEWDDLFVALLWERCARDGLEADLENQFRAHIQRGVLLLYERVETLSDLDRIVQQVAAEG